MNLIELILNVLQDLLKYWQWTFWMNKFVTYYFNTVLTNGLMLIIASFTGVVQKKKVNFIIERKLINNLTN